MMLRVANTASFPRPRHPDLHSRPCPAPARNDHVRKDGRAGLEDHPGGGTMRVVEVVPLAVPQVFWHPARGNAASRTPGTLALLTRLRAWAVWSTGSTGQYRVVLEQY